jgi:hypothetical protein
MMMVGLPKLVAVFGGTGLHSQKNDLSAAPRVIFCAPCKTKLYE